MKTLPALLVVLTVASLSLTGCSAGSLPGGSRGGSAPAAAGGGSSGGQSGPVDVCSILPQAAAASAAKMTFTSAKDVVLAKGVYSCQYGTDGYNWSVAVYESSNTENLNTLLGDLGGASNSKQVSGIGDKAWLSPVGLAAQVGSRYIEVGSADNSAANEPGYEGLAKAAIAALK